MCALCKGHLSCTQCQGCGLVKVILIRKLARALNGIDLTACHEGDVMEMSTHDARVLMAEGWAVPLVEERPSAHDRPRAYHRSRQPKQQR